MGERRITLDELRAGPLVVSTGEAHRLVLESAWYEVQVLDGLGAPVEGLALQLAEDGRGSDAATDFQGLARIVSVAGEVRSALADRPAARELLDPRWAEGIDDQLAAHGYTLQSLQQASEGLALKARERVVVALIPLLLRVRLVGMYFETSKSFLLPQAMQGIRSLCSLYAEHPGARVLVVGHADTAGADDYNLQLSLERADAIGAYLTDDVGAWLAWYEPGKSWEKRWGVREDQHMLSALPDAGAPYYAGAPSGIRDAATTAAVKRFQTDAGLEVDGVAGPDTRRALIERYMAQDGASLPAGCELVTHGCGEHFPEVASADGQAEEANRRVEVFLFDGAIVPPPPGETSPRGSTAYPTWRSQVTRTIDIAQDGGPTVSGVIVLWLHDHLGRRMGADPGAADPILREAGAPYRLSAASGEVRTGYADAEGRAVEYDFPWNVVCRVQWGKREEAHEQFPPHEEEDAAAFYEHEEYVFLESTPGGEFIARALQNLGYAGELAAAREAFAADYGAADDVEIHRVHAEGEPKRSA